MLEVMSETILFGISFLRQIQLRLGNSLGSCNRRRYDGTAVPCMGSGGFGSGFNGSDQHAVLQAVESQL